MNERNKVLPPAPVSLSPLTLPIFFNSTLPRSCRAEALSSLAPVPLVERFQFLRLLLRRLTSFGSTGRKRDGLLPFTRQTVPRHVTEEIR